MSAVLYAPCTPADCGVSDAYVSFLGGTAVSWQAITETGPSACLVGFVCLRGGIPISRIWLDALEAEAPTVEYPPVVPTVPVVPTQPEHPGNPVATPEPSTWAMIGAGLAALFARRRA